MSRIASLFIFLSLITGALAPVILTPATSEAFQAAAVAQAVSVDVARAHLIIPEIGVNAVIDDMGLTPAGAMAVPGNTIEVGWYRLGPRPGQIGSAVIGGHNEWNGIAGLFAHLDRLTIGDTLSVVDTNGVSTSFVVREMRTYDPGDDATAIFESLDGAHLNLITCSGVWDPITKSYTKRLVVFTDAVS